MDSTFVLLFSKSQREPEGGEHKKLENNVTIRKKYFKGLSSHILQEISMKK